MQMNNCGNVPIKIYSHWHCYFHLIFKCHEIYSPVFFFNYLKVIPPCAILVKVPLVKVAAQIWPTNHSLPR